GGEARPADQPGAGARGRGDRCGDTRGGVSVLHSDARRRRARDRLEDAGLRPGDAARGGGGAAAGDGDLITQSVGLAVQARREKRTGKRETGAGLAGKGAARWGKFWSPVLTMQTIVCILCS